MKEEIRTQKCAKRQCVSWAGFATGLMLVAAVLAFGGCKAAPKAGDVVKNPGGMEFAYIPAGSFQMGSTGEKDFDSQPVHKVTFAKGFYLERYEVTREQWEKVMGTKPSFVADDAPGGTCAQTCPVNDISWNDAQDFVKKLNAQNDGFTYRLPTEAEWEYAARAGSTNDAPPDLDAVAWYDKNSESHTHPVGQKKPNAWGIYDIFGNESEWVMDEAHDNYTGAPADGSAWATGADEKIRLTRGGSWDDLADAVRATYRRNSMADGKGIAFTVRVVAEPKA